MSQLLKHYADLYTGFTIRESIDHLDIGDVKTVQIKDLPKDSQVIDIDNLTGIEWRYDSKPQFLINNSILLVARGTPTAYVFKGSEADRVVVSNPFIVVNLHSDDILPEYLAWYINNANEAIKHFSINARGTSLPLTTIATVRELPVIVPPIEDQQTILDRERQAILEAKILNQLIELRREYNHAQAECLLNKAN